MADAEPLAAEPAAPADRVRVATRVLSHLASARAAIRTEAREALAARGLRPDTYAMLLLIRHAEGPCGNADIADALALPRGSTHRLLNQLHAHELAESAVNPLDRRSNDWSTSAAGNALLDELGLFGARDSQLVSGLEAIGGRTEHLLEDLTTLAADLATPQGGRLLLRALKGMEAPTLRLYILVMAAYRMLRAEATNHLQAATAGAVTLVHYMALCRTVESCSASEITGFLRVDPATAIRVVDHLVRFGYVSRHRNPADGRQVVIAITPAGVELLQTLPPYRDSGRPVDALMALPNHGGRLLANAVALDEAMSGPRDFPIPDLEPVMERFAESAERTAGAPPAAALAELAGGVTLMTTSNGRVERAFTVSVSASRSSSLISLMVPTDVAAPVLEAAQATGKFGLNVLASTHATLASRFDRPRRIGGVDGDEWSLIDGIPALKGALATILCRVDRVLDASDHQVLLGVPLQASFGETVGDPLLSWRGRYGTAASVMMSR